MGNITILSLTSASTGPTDAIVSFLATDQCPTWATVAQLTHLIRFASSTKSARNALVPNTATLALESSSSTTTAKRMATKSARTQKALVNAISACVIWPSQKLMSELKTTSPTTIISSGLQPVGNPNKTVSPVRDQLTCNAAKQLQRIPPLFFTTPTTRSAAQTAPSATWATSAKSNNGAKFAALSAPILCQL